jgi:hypothetical protein
MASKKQYSVVQDGAKPACELMPPPRSARDVVMLLEYAAYAGLANTKLAAHLAEMSALFPQETLDAYRAYRARQTGDN